MIISKNVIVISYIYAYRSYLIFHVKPANKNIEYDSAFHPKILGFFDLHLVCVCVFLLLLLNLLFGNYSPDIYIYI